MESVYKNLGAVIGFTVIILLIQNFFDDKTAQNVTLLTLFTMLILNANKLVDFTKKLGGSNNGND